MTKTSSVTLYSPPNQFGERAVWFQKNRQWEVGPDRKTPRHFTCSVAQVVADANPYDIRHDISYGTIAPGYLAVDAYNKAFAKLQSKLSSQQQWANNFIELGTTFSSLVRRVEQFARLVVALKRGRFGDAWALFNDISRKGNASRYARAQRKAQSFGDLWLECHFGWAPLGQDISALVDSLSKFNPGRKRIKVSAGASDSVTETIGAPLYASNVLQWEAFAQIGCTVRFDNPVAQLRNELGLTNLLAFAWEAVPFSFVADWFGNLGQCVESLSTFSGVALEMPYTTSKVVGKRFSNKYVHDGVLNTINVDVVRSVGAIPGPTLRIRPFNGLSPERGLTAIALLVKELRS